MNNNNLLKKDSTPWKCLDSYFVRADEGEV